MARNQIKAKEATAVTPGVQELQKNTGKTTLPTRMGLAERSANREEDVQAATTAQYTWETLLMTKTSARNELEQGCDLEEQGEFKQAFESYVRAAKLGSVEAQINLANLYDAGKGCQQDRRKAVYWYKLAIKSGSAEAAYNLGVHYREHSKSRWARYWFERAADMGDDDARIEITRSR